MKKIFLLFTILSIATCADQLHGMKKEFRFRKPYKANDKLLNFTKMVHAIKTDPEKDPYQVAELFNTPISQKYISLCDSLRDEISPFRSRRNPEEVARLLDEGADPNCVPMLHDALIMAKELSIITLLLQYGAKTNVKDNCGRTPLEQLDYHYSLLPNNGFYKNTRELLVTAMNNQ